MTARLIFLVVVACGTSFTVGANARQAGHPGGGPPAVRQTLFLQETGTSVRALRFDVAPGVIVQ